MSVAAEGRRTRPLVRLRNAVPGITLVAARVIPGESGSIRPRKADEPARWRFDASHREDGHRVVYVHRRVPRSSGRPHEGVYRDLFPLVYNASRTQASG